MTTEPRQPDEQLVEGSSPDPQVCHNQPDGFEEWWDGAIDSASDVEGMRAAWEAGARAERERVVPGAAAGLTEVILKALEDEATDHGRGFFVDRIERHKWDLMAGYIVSAVQPFIDRERGRYEALAAQLDKDMYWEPDETADWLRVKYQDGHIPEPIAAALREHPDLPEEEKDG
jgi:hypothetical protein